MLSLVAQRPEELSALLHSPGGFAWWYLDLVDAQGRSLVLIWSFGLPFLPNSRSRPTPASRPSVALAVYERGQCSFYLLQTYAPASARLVARGQQFELGESSFRLTLEGGTVSLHALLDLPIPAGGRLTGTIQARGASCQLPPSAADPTPHRWAPILVVGEGHAQLSTGHGALIEIEGRAYADSNGSHEPLPALGIEGWRWGRVALPGREIIYYLVDAASADTPNIQLVLEALPDGRLLQHQTQVRWSGARRSLYGLRWHDRLHLFSDGGLDLRLRFSALVDDGPFYLRFLVSGEDQHGQRCLGLAEQVAPARVDRPWQRPFVRMRTHLAEGPNSLWLPLFSGPAAGRFRRLMQHWFARSAPGERAA